MTARLLVLLSTWVVSRLLAATAAEPAAPAPLPVVTLTHDDTVLRESCEIRIPPGTVIADTNGNGVIQIAANGLTVRFAPDATLQGAPPATPGDQLSGIGIRIENHRDFQLVGARVHGFRNGIVATQADGLIVAGGDFSGNYRQHLRSTPAAEDGGDWLYPHHNDERLWREEYGGAVCIERSRGVLVRDIHVRRGQNGILLDRVDDAQIYDNDCSFLSGWGLALWRSCRNVISRNAFDFCVRGHVEGVYNRGQDSAGILCFEQSNDNVFAENSVTHGGDGFFGFAGREALGDLWMEKERQRLRQETGKQEVDDLIRVPAELARDLSARGCNRNILIGNDLSYAPAHGIEMTFSEGNLFLRNRLVENAICGIWGGYSSDSVIAENEIAGNGGMAYGLERGGINMEHAAGNRILGNRFRDNKCAIHLWWDNDGALLKSPGVAGNYREVTENVIANNEFAITTNHPFASLRATERLVVLQLRDDGTNHVRNNRYVANRTRLELTNAVEFAVKPGSEPSTQGPAPTYAMPDVKILGQRHPVGARPQLRGRDQILLDEWGPWDHESPWLRLAPGKSGEPTYEIFGLAEPPQIEITPASLRAELSAGPSAPGKPTVQRLTLRGANGVVPYRVRLRSKDYQRDLEGTLVAARWDTVFFPWKIDPREDLAGWRKLADSAEAIRVTLDRLDLPYGWGGPRELKSVDDATLRQRGPGNDHFGMIARARLQLPAGTWRFQTLSDDGLRVTVNDKKVLENWSWHGPTKDEGVYRQESAGEVSVEVEHFEIDGYATLQLDVDLVKNP